jgi:hypothetical protein
MNEEALKDDNNSRSLLVADPTGTYTRLLKLSTSLGGIAMGFGDRLDPVNDRVSVFMKQFTPVRLTASGQILGGPGQISGFYVSSTTAGTIILRDALTATTPIIVNTITPAVGWHACPAELANGGYASLSGTIDVTFMTRLTATNATPGA